MTFREVGVEEAAHLWDDALCAFEERGVRQSHRWGLHKEGAWTPRRFALADGDRTLAMALALERRAPLGAATLVWINAGPVWHDDALLPFLKGLTDHYAKVPRAVVRVAPRGEDSPEVRAALEAAGFSPAKSALDSGRTVVIDLTKDVDSLRAALDRKWRNQLKKAESASPRFDWGNSPDHLKRLLALHESTRGRKGLKDGVTLATLQKAARDFGPSLTVGVATVDGVDGAALSWWAFGGRATLWLSAANAAGMKACLPNALYWEAILRLKALGAVRFDLSGIDEKNNPGVTHFKLGTGGQMVTTPGEWDWSSSSLSKSAFNTLLSLARGRFS